MMELETVAAPTRKAWISEVDFILETSRCVLDNKAEDSELMCRLLYAFESFSSWEERLIYLQPMSLN